MKKILIVASIVLFGTITVKAQEESKTTASSAGEGFTLADIFVSGTISFGTEKENNIDSNSFNFSPQLGYFIDDYFAIGARLGYVSSKTEAPSNIDPNATVEDTTTTLNLGVFGRYYFTPINKFSFFGELATGILNSTREVGQTNTKQNGFFVGASPGINYFLSHNFAIEASVGLLGYETSKFDTENAEPKSTFDIGVNLSDINLGVVYRF